MTATAPIRIMIADDHTLFRSGLRMLLESQSDFQVVAEAANSSEVVSLTRQHQPEILLLDLNMPPVSGLAALREISAFTKFPRTVLLTALIDKSQEREALLLGAYGFVLKESAYEMLLKCIRCVSEGQYWIGNESVGGLIGTLRSLITDGHGSFSETSQTQFGLTVRELEIVSLIVKGLSNKEISSSLSITVETVKQHLKKIYDKVGVSSRMELAVMALHHKLVD